VRAKRIFEHCVFDAATGVYSDPRATSSTAPSGRKSPTAFWDPRVRGWRLRVEHVKYEVKTDSLFGIEHEGKFPPRLLSVTVGHKGHDLSRKMLDLVGEFALKYCTAYVHGGERGKNLSRFHLQGGSFIGLCFV